MKYYDHFSFCAILLLVIKVIYLDYSATTPVKEEVLDSYIKTCQNFIGNPNSLHRLGIKSKKLIDEATEQIARLLKVKSGEIIYTSGASESNNTAIKGIALKYQNRGKHIITTQLEHSSVIAPIQYLSNIGFDIDFVNLDEEGKVDLKHLKSLLREDTILVSIGAVSSELGIKQPIAEIGEMLKTYPKCFFHVDMTQCLGKIETSFENIDLASFSAHKFYGMKGIGGLVKKETVILEPLIHGGKSTTVFRSGTPAPALIVSLAKALRFALENLNQKQEEIQKINTYIRETLKNIDGIHINSPKDSIPHILNFSVLQIKPETLQHSLEEKDIFISTQTACSKSGTASSSVLAVTHNHEYAASSVRVSISHLTTMKEAHDFIEALKESLKRLKINHGSNR